MHPHGSAAVIGAGRAIGDAVYIGGGSRTDSASAAISTAAFAAGQVMVTYAPSSMTITGGASADWVYGTADAQGYRWGAKVLQVADLSGLAFSSAGLMSAWAVYSGPLAFAQRIQGTGNTTSPTLSGFTKGGWSAGLIVGIRGNNPAAAWTAPAGWTQRQSAGGSSTSGSVVIADIAPGSYANGAGLTFSGSGGSFAATVLELLNY